MKGYFPMTKRINQSRYAILGILSLGPKSGYDIKKIFSESFASFWSESYGQIYPILKRLKEEGLATQTTAKSAGRPDRYLYRITKKGRQEFKKWLIQPARRQVGRHDIVLKMLFGHQVSLGDNIRLVKEFRARHRQELQALKIKTEKLSHLDAHDEKARHHLLSLRYGELLNRAYLQWCEETLECLRQMSRGKKEKRTARKRPS
jgi:DNA-binding PadR family transcriptional regulator